ncbi:unnamed protein product, partial [Amoebophrya sp. A25]
GFFSQIVEGVEPESAKTAFKRLALAPPPVDADVKDEDDEDDEDAGGRANKQPAEDASNEDGDESSDHEEAASCEKSESNVLEIPVKNTKIQLSRESCLQSLFGDDSDASDDDAVVEDEHDEEEEEDAVEEDTSDSLARTSGGLHRPTSSTSTTSLSTRKVSLTFVLYSRLLCISTERGILALLQDASIIQGRWIQEHASPRWLARVQFDPDKP